MTPRKPAAPVDPMPVDPTSLDPTSFDPMPDDGIPDDAPRHTPLWALLSGWLLALEAWLRSHGGTPLRTGIRAFWTLVAGAGVVLLVGPVINPPMTLEDITSSASHATDRWIAREFAADYAIDRAPDGTLRASVEERIAAFFPDDVDERGIRRTLATEYQGHALEPSEISATLDGQPVEVGKERGASLLTLTLDSGARLAGDHEFVIRYELRNLAYPAVDDASGESIDLLQWDVFGPSWPQGFAGLDIGVTLPDDLADRLVGQPRGALAWTIIAAGEWLEPDGDSPLGYTTYRMTNDQNIPPHANAWFTMRFEPGTFTMPAPTPLFLVQTFGPLLPLLFLVVTLLLALAARAVAWSDARGRPWFVARSEAPEVSVATAAQSVEAPRALDLARALASVPRRGPLAGRRDALAEVARVARRTGLLGDLPGALTRFFRAPERRAQLAGGFRRVPRGFVRDLFLAAPPALVLVQWGLVRQLSHQAKLAVVWWPVAFVVVSTVIAAIVMWIAWSARPLTRRGALVKQELRGIAVYAERTRLLERGPSRDQALPYAVLLAPPRGAGRQVRALIESELGDADASKGWRSAEFLSGARLAVIAASVLLIPAAIATLVLLPNPYARGLTYRADDGEIPGLSYTQVESAVLSGELTRDADGRAVVEVIERLRVSIDDEGSRVPQFARQWRNTLDGQSLDLAVDSVRFDGEPVPYVTEQDRDTLLMRTRFVDVRSGTFEVEIAYTIGSAAVAVESATASTAADASGATPFAPGGVVDRVRWAALMDGWKYADQWDFAFGDDIRPLRVEFRVADDLAALASNTGWITLDTDASDEVSEWPPAVVPFGTVSEVADPDDYGDTAETTAVSGGVRVHALDLSRDEFGYPFPLTVDDLGVSLDFPAGTFAGPDADALRATRFVAGLPFAVTIGVGVIAILVGVWGILLGARRRRAAFDPGLARTVVRWLGPAATIAAIVLFVGFAGDLPGDHPAFAPLGLTTLAAVAACVASLVLVRRSRGARAPAPRR